MRLDRSFAADAISCVPLPTAFAEPATLANACSNCSSAKLRSARSGSYQFRQAIGHAKCQVFLREFRDGGPEPLDRRVPFGGRGRLLPGVRLALRGGGGARLSRLRFYPLSFNRLVLEDLHGRGHSPDFVAPAAVLDLDSEVPTGQVARFGRQAATAAGRSSGR